MAGKNYRLCCMVSVILLGLVAPSTWAVNSIDQIITGLHQRYKSPGGLVISYSREVKTRTMSMLGNKVKGDIASGQIYVLPPNLLRVEQQKPRKETLLTDGKSLWWIIPEEKKVYQYSSDQFGKELQIITDLWEAPSRLKKQFDITLLNTDQQGRYVLEMVPGSTIEQASKIRIHVSRDYSLNLLEMINPVGTTTIFYFHSIRPEHLAKESFGFTIPEGFTVVHE